ncbi:site-specific DNA-methyltransferase [Pseudomonas chlororaphis]|uniref:DNA-methyltransferase n=1 Tax=Pseudomonas chlororaphis TaxID=587753 RepID=UPI002367CABE|nr:site-specific DNA-methyltransferase [Pseudomonas chlororaphis]WDG79202.1 site-specific DNA-methyltransferase [Pseudomonas chlororaphis]WDG87746.1 site-specific DNA-methyltransferase [Pseudomonas chlororaphis]
MSEYQLYQGDCLEQLRQMPDNSVDSIVTDPPYGLSFMGKKWDYDVPAVEVWVECLRVLKPGGHLLAFAGTRTQHRMAVRIEDAGFQIRDMIAWVYGSGFPKSHNLDGKHEGWGTALKPALEPITVARKPFPGTVAENVQAHGTGALNIDSCRVNTNEDTARISNGAIRGGKFAAGGSAPGPIAGGHDAGRWPANLIHDGSPEVLAAFPDAPGQLADASTSDTQRAGQNYYGNMKRGRGKEASANSDNSGVVGFQMKPGARRLDSGSAARFFYCAKASRTDRHDGLANPGPQFTTGTTLRKVENVSTTGNNHPTVKPTDLMAYLLRLVTPPGGTVLDPYMGSGSTGKAAMREGFNFIGIERDRDEHGNQLGYMAIAHARIEHERNKPKQLNLEEFATARVAVDG